MIKLVAVKRPVAWVIRIEGDRDRPLRRNKNRIAHGTRKSLIVDGDDLKVMTVQVNGVRHRGLVAQDDLDALAFRHGERIVGVEGLSVEPPIISGMAAGQSECVRALGASFGKPGDRGEAPLQPQIQRSRFALALFGQTADLRRLGC